MAERVDSITQVYGPTGGERAVPSEGQAWGETKVWIEVTGTSRRAHDQAGTEPLLDVILALLLSVLTDIYIHKYSLYQFILGPSVYKNIAEQKPNPLSKREKTNFLLQVITGNEVRKNVKLKRLNYDITAAASTCEKAVIEIEGIALVLFRNPDTAKIYELNHHWERISVAECLSAVVLIFPGNLMVMYGTAS
ncbi:hypothetical protein Tcan_08168 [Toxocara canis]|uniref:Uncharacterized protein n=1 Tax=Toxocara canis TaxID=6265 RepID=A0A0B2VWJ4_TOXCA|nr:hypothetical protein Tcan_08168 [Toxocara canis]